MNTDVMLGLIIVMLVGIGIIMTMLLIYLTKIDTGQVLEQEARWSITRIRQDILDIKDILDKPQLISFDNINKFTIVIDKEIKE